MIIETIIMVEVEVEVVEVEVMVLLKLMLQNMSYFYVTRDYSDYQQKSSRQMINVGILINVKD